jgi:protein subunit release factor A
MVKYKHSCVFSTCSVAVVPEMSSDDAFDVPENEIKVEYVRSSGAGGQNVNTNDTAAKLLHIPTGN